MRIHAAEFRRKEQGETRIVCQSIELSEYKKEAQDETLKEPKSKLNGCITQMKGREHTIVIN
jgi:hypothetical protein